MGLGDVVNAVHEVVGAVQAIQYFLDPRHWLLNVLAQDVLGEVWKQLTSLIVTTVNEGGGTDADFTTVKAVGDYEPLVQATANAGLVAVGTWSSYRLMWTQSYRSHYSAHIILPRLFLAAVLINFAVPLVQIAVDFSNALCATVLIAEGHNVFVGALRELLTTSTKDIGGGPGLTVLTTATLVFGYLLLGLAYFVRYALLVVLTVTAPLAALAFVLPDTHKYAREWGSLFASTLLMQPMQLLILAIAFALEQEGGLPIRHVYALCALWIAFKVPGALHAASSVGTRAKDDAKRHVGKLVTTLVTKGVA